MGTIYYFQGDCNMKKMNVTVGIPAFNEEENILNLIESIKYQNTNNFNLTEIIIASDGSTDNTVKNIHSIKNNKIKMILGTKRIGKASRINQIFEKSRGDIIVLLDADVKLLNKNVLSELIKLFYATKDVGIVSGRAQPIPAKTFVEKAVNASFRAYDKLRLEINGGRNPYSAEGRIIALAKSLYKQIKIPNYMIAIDNYLYFYCITNNFTFKFAQKATVLYRSPSTLRDQLRQNTRFLLREKRLRRLFGDIVTEQYAIPPKVKVNAFCSIFITSPISSAAILAINLYCRYLANGKGNTVSAHWQTASSTKTLIK